MKSKAFASLILIALLPAAARAGDVTCYDAKVKARIIEQIPSVIPDCNDCVIMEWPWFIDLGVNRVVEGVVSGGRIIHALSVQHTYMLSLRAGTWLLRRNKAGLFNIVTADDPLKIPRCPASAEPAQPYLISDSESLDQLRGDGERR